MDKNLVKQIQAEFGIFATALAAKHGLTLQVGTIGETGAKLSIEFKSANAGSVDWGRHSDGVIESEMARITEHRNDLLQEIEQCEARVMDTAIERDEWRRLCIQRERERDELQKGLARRSELA